MRYDLFITSDSHGHVYAVYADPIPTDGTSDRPATPGLLMIVLVEDIYFVPTQRV